MFAHRRSLSLIFVFLTFKDGPVLVACQTVGPGINTKPVLTPPSIHPGPFTPPSFFPYPPNSFSRFLPANNQLPELQPSVPTICPDTKDIPKLTITQATFHPLNRDSDGLPSLYPQAEPCNTLSTPNYAPENIIPPFPVISTQAFDVPQNVGNKCETINEIPIVPSQIECLTVIDEPCPCISQTVQVDSFGTTPYVGDSYQSPIVIKAPPFPTISPYIVSPYPGVLPSQNTIQENCASNTFTESYPQLVNTEINVPSSPIETAVDLSNDFGCYEQAPVSLQINMASPWIPEPVIVVMSPPPQVPPSVPSQFDYASFMPPPYPIIVMEKKKSSLKTLLPILLVSLLDGGCRNNGCGCCSSQCGSNIPIPFPVVIPTNNAIVNSRTSSKKAAEGNNN